jgi:hypothetical protein
VSLGPKRVLEYIEVGSEEYYERSKDDFFGISTNIWPFCVSTADSDSLRIGDSEYIGISWRNCVG